MSGARLTGAAVLALPPEWKNLAQFQQEDTARRGYAQQQSGYGAAQQTANHNAVGSAATGTVLGAAAGVAIGATAGAAGVGAYRRSLAPHCLEILCG